jgi:copper homeostasis protein (lipoprotein)
MLGAACNKHQETETAVEAKPKRPPTPSGTMELRGEYSRSGDIGVFRDCTTGQQWPVADEGNNHLLDRAYLASGVPLGAPLVVTVEGGIDHRPSPGGGRQMTLIVARFVQVGPGATCSEKP